MPPQHRLGFHNESRTTPTTEPSAGNNPEPLVRIAQPRLRVSALQNQQLLPQAEILGDQPHSAETRPQSSRPESEPPAPLLMGVIREGSKPAIVNKAHGQPFCAPHGNFAPYTRLTQFGLRSLFQCRAASRGRHEHLLLTCREASGFCSTVFLRQNFCGAEASTGND